MKSVLLNLLCSMFITLIVFSCKSSSDNNGKSSGSGNTEIPGITAQELEKLVNQCTYVDYIFHTLPFSLSQDEPASITQNIMFTDYKKPVKHIPQNCKPFARKFFKIGAEFAYDVDVYFSSGCQFYVYLKENKPVYANYMTPDGIDFYNRIINMVNAQTNPNQ